MEIQVRPIGGLANRMRVIAATIKLAEKIGADVKCLWESNNELGAEYLDLFRPPQRFNITSGNEGKLISSCQTNTLKRVVASLWNKTRGIDYYFTARNVNEIVDCEDNYNYHLFFEKIEPLLRANKNICFVSGNYLAEIDDLSMFEPIESIRKEINAFSSVFDTHTYGLHIRRTDNIWAIENSPITMFCDIIEKKLGEEASARFYLSSDDPETVNYLNSKYMDKLFIRPKRYGRASLAAMKDAVVDMWLLSQTKHIFGSYYSSFSEMAALIGNSKLTILKSK